MLSENERDQVFTAQFGQIFTPDQHARLDAETLRQIRVLQERAYLYGVQVATEVLSPEVGNGQRVSDR